MNASQYNSVKNRALSRLKDINSQITIYKMTIDDLNKKFYDLLDSLPKATPQSLRQYLHGYLDCLKASYHDGLLEFCYILPDGQIVSTYKKSARYYGKLGLTPKELHEQSNKKSGFFWEGTDKPFFISGE